MKKVELTLTQINYIIEESFNRGLSSYQPEADYSGDASAQEPFKELHALKDELYKDFKLNETAKVRACTQTFSDRLMETFHSAKGMIDELVKLHNGSFVVYTSEDAFDEKEEVLTDDFMKNSTSIIVNTTFNDNETVWLLKLEGAEIHYITEHGDIDSVDIQFVDDHTVCDIADWIAANNLTEKAKV